MSTTSKPTPDKAKQNPPAPTAPPAAASPLSAPDGNDVTTPPGGPKADDTVSGTVTGQLGYNTKMVDALLDERAGYLATGRDERVTAVDKQLAAYGTTAAEAATERATRTQREASTDPASDEKDRQRAKMVDALLDEREGYSRMGQKERVAQVDESLESLGTTYTEAAQERAQRLKDRAAVPDAQRAGGHQTR